MFHLGNGMFQVDSDMFQKRTTNQIQFLTAGYNRLKSHFSMWEPAI